MSMLYTVPSADWFLLVCVLFLSAMFIVVGSPTRNCFGVKIGSVLVARGLTGGFYSGTTGGQLPADMFRSGLWCGPSGSIVVVVVYHPSAGRA